MPAEPSTPFSEAANLRPGDVTWVKEGDPTPVPPKFSEAADFCREAARLVSSDRRPANADKLINFRTTAELWNAYLSAKNIAGESHRTTPHDVACMMELFKIARRFIGTYNADNYVDAAGYAGCAGELASNASK